MGGGPTYQIQYLDIPTVKGFRKTPRRQSRRPRLGLRRPVLRQPAVLLGRGGDQFVPNDKAAFDNAVSCDGKTITFKMSKPERAFNYATTLGMSPVPNPVDHPGVDIGEGYGTSNDSKPLSNGPYKVEDYTPGAGGTMTLVRNDELERGAGSDPEGLPRQVGGPARPRSEAGRPAAARAVRRRRLRALRARTSSPRTCRRSSPTRDTVEPEFAGRGRQRSLTRTPCTTGSTSTRSRT